MIAIRLVGWPQGVWWRAMLGMCALLLFTRLVTSAENNVNLAFRVAEGWEHIFPSQLSFLGLLFAVGSLAFVLIDGIGRRLWSMPRARRENPS